MVFHLLRLQLTLLYFSSLDILCANDFITNFVIMVFHLLVLQLTLLVPLIYCVQTFYHKFCNYGFSPSSPSISFVFQFPWYITCKYFNTNFCNYGFSPSPSIDSFVFQFPWYITCKHFITNFRNYGFSPSSLSIHSFYFSSLDILRANILSQISVIMVFHLLRLQLTLVF